MALWLIVHFQRACRIGHSVGELEGAEGEIPVLVYRTGCRRPGCCTCLSMKQHPQQHHRLAQVCYMESRPVWVSCHTHRPARGTTAVSTTAISTAHSTSGNTGCTHALLPTPHRTFGLAPHPSPHNLNPHRPLAIPVPPGYPWVPHHHHMHAQTHRTRAASPSSPARAQDPCLPLPTTGTFNSPFPSLAYTQRGAAVRTALGASWTTAATVQTCRTARRTPRAYARVHLLAVMSWSPGATQGPKPYM